MSFLSKNQDDDSEDYQKEPPFESNNNNDNTELDSFDAEYIRSTLRQSRQSMPTYTTKDTNKNKNKSQLEEDE